MPSSCYSWKIDPETLFSANHQNLQKIFPKMSQLGLGTSEADLAKYPLFSPILGGISKLFKIHINRIGSKFTCGLEDSYTKPEKIFSSNGAFLANFRSNQFSRLANFSWARTFKNLKNSKIKKFLQFSPNKCSRVNRPWKARKRWFQRV